MLGPTLTFITMGVAILWCQNSVLSCTEMLFLDSPPTELSTEYRIETQLCLDGNYERPLEIGSHI